MSVGGAEERKLATVLFADLAGSTELAGRLDAERMRALLGEVYDQLSLAAGAFGGTVEKFIGDAIMAVFGVPVAHEDDPERAVRAALTMRSRMAAIARRHEVDVVLRIGITTGVVVTGASPGRDFLVTGESVNLAARLQQAAEPGEILLSERTFRPVQHLVRTVAPRSLAVKGRSGPVLAYAVEGIAPSTVYRRRRAQGPFVGRAGELSLITTLCERAVEHRRAHLITVVGEPGIGKSRLAEEAVIELQFRPDPPQVWISRCRPYGEGGAYQPLAEPLLRSAAVEPRAPAGEARRQVIGELQALLGEGTEAIVADLLRSAGLDPGPSEEPADAAVELARRALDAWRTVLLRLAERSPLLLVIEDAQWAEPALLDLVEAIASSDQRVPLVILCLTRDEMIANRSDWGTRSRNATVLALDTLVEGDMQRLASALSDDQEAAADRAIELAGGNPFFLEEILAMQDEGGRVVPETVQGVIAARLDLLKPEEKLVLQRASLIGRTFSQSSLAAIGVEATKTLLAGLAGRDLLTPVAGEWGFKHMLIRDVAYESIARSERGRLHLRLARAQEEAGDTDAQVVAAHYATAAELGEREARTDAVRLLLDAAREARSVYAHGLGLRQAERALGLADDETERARALEAVGDAHWMAERVNKAMDAYRDSLEHAEAAGMDARATARLRWKWVDIHTRWTDGKPPEELHHEIHDAISRGLTDARAAGHEALEARLLVAEALFVWRIEVAEPPQVAALDLTDRALAIGARLGRPGIVSAANDARSALLTALHRYREAAETDERRFAMLDRLSSREEQMDACAGSARSRQNLGDYAGSVAAVQRAESLAAGDDPRWLILPARTMIESYFLWDRWDDAVAAYRRYLPVFRSGELGRRTTLFGLASGVAAGVHLLRGEREAADRLEQRLTGRSEGFNLIAAQALLGCGEPELALDRARDLRGPRLRIWAIRAEAYAMLAAWDELDGVLARVSEIPAAGDLPRVMAQIDRARGIAGDDIALHRAIEEFGRLGCRFEQARCLELAGRFDKARRAYEELGAQPSLVRARAR
ncbi:MAG: adenylate/guanylate cyclase domain-containing protein [Gaiellales bacterium]|nr:adenylate/guanylate cyclase domain-containing protein [Gaiellales bacterium]